MSYGIWSAFSHLNCTFPNGTNHTWHQGKLVKLVPLAGGSPAVVQKPQQVVDGQNPATFHDYSIDMETSLWMETLMEWTHVWYSGNSGYFLRLAEWNHDYSIKIPLRIPRYIPFWMEILLGFRGIPVPNGQLTIPRSHDRIQLDPRWGYQYFDILRLLADPLVKMRFQTGSITIVGCFNHYLPSGKLI